MTNPEEKIDSNRRGFFALAALPLLVVGLGGRARAAEAPAEACFNPASLTAGQKNMRASAKFRQATDPLKKCGTCMFFSASTTNEACGKCKLLLNGPVGASNVCDSWSKKA